MLRTAPHHVLKALRRYDSKLGARWNPARRGWEVTRLVTRVRIATRFMTIRDEFPECVLFWPHDQLTGNVLDRIRYSDTWTAPRLRDFITDRVVKPVTAQSDERARDLKRYQADGKRELQKCLLRDTGARTTVSLANNN